MISPAEFGGPQHPGASPLGPAPCRTGPEAPPGWRGQAPDPALRPGRTAGTPPGPSASAEGRLCDLGSYRAATRISLTIPDSAIAEIPRMRSCGALWRKTTPLALRHEGIRADATEETIAVPLPIHRKDPSCRSPISIAEAQSEAFCDREDDVYRSFWDSSGALHWGYFPDLSWTDPDEFPEACQRWTDLLLEKSGIGPASHVLDVGCGNGTTSVYLAHKTGCRVDGIDISGVRVGHAKARAGALPNVAFHKASVSQLPFPDGTFTHIWSQATLYHVPDRNRALDEIHRVLAEGGRLVLDDLVTPSPSITGMLKQAAAKHVYRDLVRHDIEQPFPWERGAFDAVVASGVFTFGHVRAPALRHLTDQLKEGGILVVTFREDYLDSEPEIERTLRDLPLRPRSRTTLTVFGDTPMTVRAFEKREEATA
ncbi:SAM-dependent methyltransferase [Streptomyces sp. NPDC048644]|uniref:SAM-dependent methyltransferase n=1 Tax=Streptomyces sp. NPDC048644 TaxID=3365582 RepID=UPI003719F49B